MTDSLQDDFYFKDGMWQLRPNAVEAFGYMLRIDGNEKLFESSEANEEVRKAHVKADSLIQFATEFVHQSVYESDIQVCGGMILDSINFESWDKARVWFRLNGPEDRILGVLLISDIPHDVYCEPPG